jgi:hypothetical protein
LNIFASSEEKQISVFQSPCCHTAWQGNPATRIRTFALINFWGKASPYLAFWCHYCDFLTVALKRLSSAVFIKIHQQHLYRSLIKILPTTLLVFNSDIISAIKTPQNRPRGVNRSHREPLFNLYNRNYHLN